MSNSPVAIDVTIDPEVIKENNLCDEVLKVLKPIRPAWFDGDKALSTLKSKSMYRLYSLDNGTRVEQTTQVFTGGISNLLFGYYIEEKFEEDVILLRIYGNGTELMIDRHLEQKNIQVLHEAGRSPPLYASFNNGIAYGFVNGVTLDPNTVRDKTIARLIAEEMINVHAVKPEGQEVKSRLWEKMYRFLDLGPDKFDDSDRQQKFVSTIKPKDVLRQEIDELKSHLEVLNSPVVFCHNDLLLKNVIFNEEKGQVYFIDHEYAMFNYEHFDIGNHFAEYAGVDDLDFTRYPDKTYQLDWLRYYLEEKAKFKGNDPASITDKDVEICYVKSNKFALAAHLFWGLWGLVQAKNSLIDFGFLEYAQQKLDEYFARKEEFLSLTLPS